MKKLFIRWSPAITLVITALAFFGYYLGSSLQLKLSLTDLLPEGHPAVVKFEKLTKVVGGIGYFTVVLKAKDRQAHLKIAPTLAAEFQKSPLVRNVFYHREKRFFIDRLLYYLDLSKLKEMEKNIASEIKRAKRSVLDLGLFEEEKGKPAQAFDEEFRKLAKESAEISPYLISKDGENLLLMVKPSFDSTDLEKSRELIALAEGIVKRVLPASVTYEFAERYYSKVVETDMIQNDIFTLGAASLLLIALILYAYVRTFRGMLIVFIPVMLGMGITAGITRLFIGHINIITGFLMGIVSGLGVDYGIHLLLRLQMEKEEPSSPEADPVWRTLSSTGHSVFIGAVSASLAFFLLCFSSFRAFSEFGFVCGVGIFSVLVCLMFSFSALARFLKVDSTPKRKSWFNWSRPFPTLSRPKAFTVGLMLTFVVLVAASRVGFEYDFDKMLQHSKEAEDQAKLVDAVYGRSNTPSAVSAPDKATAIAVEKVVKAKYVPQLVSEIVSGATIVPEHQPEKQEILLRIEKLLAPIKDKWIEREMGVSGSAVRTWVTALPFQFSDLPAHIQDALRGTQKTGFLIYLYPAIKHGTAQAVRTYAAMVRDIEEQFPTVLTGSDAVVFSDILDLINHDGLPILGVIFIAVGLIIWLNVRNAKDTLFSYLPLIFALPVGMGLMAIFGVKFNIFNVAIIPSFVAIGIDVPIHIVHRARETGSGFKAARDLAASINLALLTAAVGFGCLIFARAGVLKSLGWIALLGTLAIWWIGVFLLPAILERTLRKEREAMTPSSGTLTEMEMTPS